MKAIPHHTGYFATKSGHIVSTKRYPLGKQLAGCVNEDGYLTVTVTADDGIKRKTPVHRLVALAYLGAAIGEDQVVRHLDGNRTRNVPGNLQYGTPMLNFADAVRHGTRYLNPTGNGSVMSRALVLDVQQRLRAGLSGVDAARLTGVSPASVSRIRHGLRAGHDVRPEATTDRPR